MMAGKWLYLTKESDVAKFNIERDFEYVGNFVNPMNLQPCCMFSMPEQTTMHGLRKGLTLVIPMKLHSPSGPIYNR